MTALERMKNDVKRAWNLAKLPRRKKPVVGATPADVMHVENKWRLLRYRVRNGAESRFDTPILLVPSLINRHYVLDLQPGKSFAEYLVNQGHEVWIIDWGTPGDEDRFLTFDEVCDRYLGRAIRKVARESPTGKVHLMGYCLGGTLAAIHAAARPEKVQTLTVLAAPVAFRDGGLLSAWVCNPSFDVDLLGEEFGNLPWPLMQAAFLMLRPTMSLSKAVHMVDRAWDDRYLDGFLALETWGNDNVSFPGACFREYAQELYRKDALIKGSFRLSGRKVALERITCPTLAVTFEHDNIVPWKSAAVLLDRIKSKDKERIHLPGGHVGAVVSRKASETLWPRLSAWWAERDGDAEEANVLRVVA